MNNPIAVGVDGSDASLIALRWAVAEARLRSAELRVVIAHPPPLDWPHDSADHVQHLRTHIAERVRQVRSAVDRVIGEALATLPSAPAPTDGVLRAPPAVSTDVVEGNPTEVLAARSRDVALLVVGGRGHGAWKGLLSGSVTGQLAGHTAAPLAVVRALPTQSAPSAPSAPPRGRILVGVDGARSRAAIRFAFEEARWRGAAVDLVAAWQYPVLGSRPTSAETTALLEAAARASIAEGLGDAVSDHPDVPMSTSVHLGHPVDVLSQLAGAADMVVIGSRGRGGFAALLLGSVAIGVLHRVPGPVVVVPQAR